VGRRQGGEGLLDCASLEHGLQVGLLEGASFLLGEVGFELSEGTQALGLEEVRGLPLFGLEAEGEGALLAEEGVPRSL